MLRWIILIAVWFLIYKLVRRILASPKLPKRPPPQQIQDEMVQDPVCKIYLPKRQAVVLNGPQNETHYFCSTQCRDKFMGKDSK
jgi:YHS domain-containing protein